jgi:hypothetical protein
VTTSIFKMLDGCSDADPDNVVLGSDLYLDSDLSISCSSNRYDFGVKYAKCMILVYPVGVPVFYLALLWPNKDMILQYHKDVMNNVPAEEIKLKNDKILPMQYLFSCYKPEYWYFEVIETLRRLLLTGFLSLLFPGTTKQLVVGLFVNIFFVILYSFLNPYKEKDLQFISFLCQCQLTMIFFISILFKEGVNISSAFIDSMLIISIFLGIFYEIFVNPLLKRYSYVMTNDVLPTDCIASCDIEMTEKDVIQKQDSFVLY